MEKFRPKSAFINRGISPINTHTESFGNKMHKTFFIQEQNKGDKFFRTTRVGSCRKIIVRNGIPFALTFRVKNPRGEPLTHYNYSRKSLPKNTTNYFWDYCTRREENNLSMKNKPLIPYNPNHKRSRLPEDCKFRVIRNYSNFEIGREGLVNRKQWISTYKDTYKTSKINRFTNPEILSDMARRTHYKLNNIEYP